MKKVILSVLLLSASALLGGCSCEAYYAWKDMGPVPEAIARKAHWSKECKAWAAPLLEKSKSVPSQGEEKAAVASEPRVIARTFPSKDAIQLEKTTPKDVQLGAVFNYSIKVTNLTDIPLDDVVVVERMPNGFNFTGASPSANNNGGKLTWSLGSLAPKANEEITVSGFATNPGSLTSRATVSYTVPARADVQVLQAVLQITKTEPNEVLVCETVPVTFKVKNTGNGPAKNVTLIDNLPDGLSTEEGSQRLALEVGTLDPNQSKEFTVNLKATKAGVYTTRTTATSSDSMKVVSSATTVVARQPVLSVSKNGPGRQYIGRPVTYEITVSNTGDGPARNTILEDAIPNSVTSITASDNGEVSGSQVTWQLGTIAPNHYKKVSITYTVQDAGDLTSSATATAFCASKVSANARTSVVGVPAVLLEVVDVGDPVEVGGEATYIITATNQGSAPGTNIRIVCKIEDKMECVSLNGATPGTCKDKVITFAPLANLAPRTKAIWRVVTKADKPGDVLFKVSMTMDEFSRPIEETESTNLYE